MAKNYQSKSEIWPFVNPSWLQQGTGYPEVNRNGWVTGKPISILFRPSKDESGQTGLNVVLLVHYTNVIQSFKRSKDIFLNQNTEENFCPLQNKTMWFSVFVVLDFPASTHIGHVRHHRNQNHMWETSLRRINFELRRQQSQSRVGGAGGRSGLELKLWKFKMKLWIFFALFLVLADQLEAGRWGIKLKITSFHFELKKNSWDNLFRICQHNQVWQEQQKQQLQKFKFKLALFKFLGSTVSQQIF